MEVGTLNIYELFLFFLHTIVGARVLLSFGAIFAVLTACALFSFPRLCAIPISSITKYTVAFRGMLDKKKRPPFSSDRFMI